MIAIGQHLMGANKTGCKREVFKKDVLRFRHDHVGRRVYLGLDAGIYLPNAILLCFLIKGWPLVFYRWKATDTKPDAC
jgi:hypothetical protein